MDLEHRIEVLPIDDKFQTTIAELQQQGWQLAPGVAPTATYHLIRAKPPKPDAEFHMTIDPSKVHILRANGKLE